MNILEYIEDLMDQGISEEDACTIADFCFDDDSHDRDTWDYEPDEYPDEFDMEFM